MNVDNAYNQIFSALIYCKRCGSLLQYFFKADLKSIYNLCGYNQQITYTSVNSVNSISYHIKWGVRGGGSTLDGHVSLANQFGLSKQYFTRCIHMEHPC